MSQYPIFVDSIYVMNRKLIATSQENLSKVYYCVVLCSVLLLIALHLCMTNYMKYCSFLNADFIETTKEVEHLFKKSL